MIAYYPMLKHLHMTLALVSVLLFLYRWLLAWGQCPPAAEVAEDPAPCQRHLPVAVRGAAGGDPANEPGPTTLADGQADRTGGLHRPRRHGAQAPCAQPEARGRPRGLAVFGYMVGAAITKSTLSWLA